MSVMDDAQILWDYHQMHHEPRNTDIAIGLGSHDIGVAEHTADLYHQGRFPLIVFTGANAPTTVEAFPRGEAVHYAERAEELGVPDTAIVLEEHARNTGENFTLTRALLDREGIHPSPRPSSAGPTNSAAPTRPARSSGPNSTSSARRGRRPWPTTSPPSATRTRSSTCSSATPNASGSTPTKASPCLSR